MKILRLNLTAFGPFSDAVLDLSAGEQGLHVVYGPNEAGKSSALRAIGDLFYGIHARTPDNFRHPYPKLRIGAHLRHSDGTCLELVRRKATQNSLRLRDDQTPLDEQLLNRFLASADRDLFEMMFGLNPERLRRGGEEITQGGGRIGELLFAAGAGIAGLQQVQAELKQEADELMKPAGRSGRIVSDLKEYKDQCKAIKDALVSVDTWREHDSALRSAQSQRRDLDEQMSELRSRQSRLQRIRNAIAPVSRWKKARHDLQGLQDVPLLPEEFAETCNQTLVDLRKAEQQQEDASRTLAQLTEELDRIEVPVELLREADSLERLRDRLGGHSKAMVDRPGLDSLRLKHEADACEILRNLGRQPDLSQIEQLRLPADRTVRIQNLGNQKDGLVQRLEGNRRECRKLTRQIERIQRQLDELPQLPDEEGLRRVLVEAQKAGDIEAQLQEAQDEAHHLEQRASAELKKLTLWSGTLAELEELAVPQLASVDRFGDQLNRTESSIAALEERIQDAAFRRAELELEIEQLEREQAIPTEADLREARQRRDEGWKLIAHSLDASQPRQDAGRFLAYFPGAGSLAEAFEHSIAEADRIADVLRSDADRVATKAALTSEVEKLGVRESRTQAALEQARAERDQVQQEWTALWQSLQITPLTPVEMREWVHRQQEIAAWAARLRESNARAGQLQKRRDSLRQKLQAALAEVDTQTAAQARLSELVERAGERCERIRDSRKQSERLCRQLQEAREELADADAELSQSQAALQRWESDWQSEMQRLGLPSSAEPSEANSVLTGISELFRNVREAEQYRDRIDGIDRESLDFKADVRRFAERIAPELASRNCEEIVTTLVARMQAARSADQKRAALERQHEEQTQKLQLARERIAQIGATLSEMCRQAGCAACEELTDACRRSAERRRLEDQLRDYEGQVIDQSGGTDLDAFVCEVEAAAADGDALQPQIDALEEQIQALGRQRDEVLGQIERAQLQLQQIDGSTLAADAAMKCESVASRLEEDLQRLVVLRLSSLLLHAGVEEHRKRNQGPVLERASEIFRAMTLGSFEGLSADFNDRGEPILTGVRSGTQEKVPVSGMSDGTCDQLYLALRLASLEKWLQQHEPVPLIVDDIFLNFDDERSTAGLQVLADLSRRTQVVFFTHHKHLVELAEKALPQSTLFVTSLPEA